MLKIIRFELNMFQENTYLLYDSDTREALIVDPGMYYPEEVAAVEKYIDDNNLTLTQIVNTHMHLDHSFGIASLRSKYGVGLAAGEADAPLAATLQQQCLRFGIKGMCTGGEQVDRHLHQDDTIQLGHYSLVVIEVPGHSPGGIALYCRQEKFVIVGDSLFRGSIGRTDLEGGNHEQLVKAIQQGLLSLPPDTNVLSGHGPDTTIGDEIKSNPYL